MSRTTNLYLDKKRDLLLEAAYEALNICVKEGISVPEFENDDELIAWYEQSMDFERYELDEGEGRPY